MRETKKYENLDGLRGLAAAVVVLLHYVSAFAPFLIGLAITQRHTPLDKWVATTPLGLPFAGNFSVCIFFVLSGFVLSLSFFKSKSHAKLTASAARRYFRLMFPVLASVLLAYIALRIGAIHSQRAAAISGSTNWLGDFWNFPAHFGDALVQGSFGVFFQNVRNYNVVLWTMPLELFGSFMIFLFLALFGTVSRRWVLYLVFGISLIKTYYPAFLIGMAFCDLMVNHYDSLMRFPKKAFIGLLPLAVWLGSWNTETPFHGLYNDIKYPLFTPLQLEIFAHIVAAAIVVLAVLQLPRLARFFETRPLQFLGKISFSLYLTHFIVIGTFSSIVFDRLVPKLGYALAMPIMFLSSVVVMVVTAVLFNRFVDVNAITASRKIGDWLLAKPRGKQVAATEAADGELPVLAATAE